MKRARVFGILPGLAMLAEVIRPPPLGWSLTLYPIGDTGRISVDFLRELRGYPSRRRVALLREQGWVGAPIIHHFRGVQ